MPLDWVTMGLKVGSKLPSVQPGQAGAAVSQGLPKVSAYQELAALQGPLWTSPGPPQAGLGRMVQAAVQVEPGQVLMVLAVHPGEIAADDNTGGRY